MLFLGSIRLPVVGRVSMDLITLDATDVPDALLRPGAEIELIGPNLTPDDVARSAGTIGYELMCAISPRVPVQVVGADSGGHGTAHGTPPASAH